MSHRALCVVLFIIVASVGVAFLTLMLVAARWIPESALEYVIVPAFVIAICTLFGSFLYDIAASFLREGTKK